MNTWGEKLTGTVNSRRARHSRGGRPLVPMVHCPTTCSDCRRSELNLSLPRFVVHLQSLLPVTRTTSETLCKGSERRWQGNYKRNRKKYALHGRHSSSKWLRNARGLTKNRTLVCEN